jgi:tRNA threonylcarbamoyl adenosine modification protein YeaZ
VTAPPLPEPASAALDAPVLAFDGGSPVASVAVARGGALLAVRALVEARSSGVLLALIEATLAEAGVVVTDLAGVAALRGPGSFTGARVTLATALGLRLGGVPRATAVSTLEALALAAPGSFQRPLVAVDALRGDWFLQPFEAGVGGPTPTGEPALVALEAPLPSGIDGLVGFGLAALAERWPGLAHHQPEALAGAVAIAASRGRWRWDESLLARPLYLRPPATRQPK